MIYKLLIENGQNFFVDWPLLTRRAKSSDIASEAYLLIRKCVLKASHVSGVGGEDFGGLTESVQKA